MYGTLKIKFFQLTEFQVDIFTVKYYILATVYIHLGIIDTIYNIIIRAVKLK